MNKHIEETYSMNIRPETLSRGSLSNHMQERKDKMLGVLKLSTPPCLISESQHATMPNHDDEIPFSPLVQSEQMPSNLCNPRMHVETLSTLLVKLSGS